MYWCRVQLTLEEFLHLHPLCTWKLTIFSRKLWWKTQTHSSHGLIKWKIVKSFLPIHVTFKKASKKWQKASADIQCDYVDFISHNTDYICKDLEFTTRGTEQKFKNECYKETEQSKYIYIKYREKISGGKGTYSMISHLLHCTNGPFKIISLPKSIDNLQTTIDQQPSTGN